MLTVDFDKTKLLLVQVTVVMKIDAKVGFPRGPSGSNI
jgi:hypothetical protein